MILDIQVKSRVVSAWIYIDIDLRLCGNMVILYNAVRAVIVLKYVQ